MTESYKSEGWSSLPGRGQVVQVTLDREWDRDLLGSPRTVQIDGVDYEVLGAESWAIQTLRKGTSVALLVRRIGK